MFDRVMQNLPQQYRQVFFDNVQNFGDALMMEQELRSLVKNQLTIVAVVERCCSQLESYIKDSIFSILREQPMPMQADEEAFGKSLTAEDSILITLRINDEVGDVIGFAKGGPLEDYRLRRGTFDGNYGKRNTIYLEGIVLKPGFWGESGGHLLRIHFLKEATKRGHEFMTGYAHRDVIVRRAKKGEIVEIVQRYDPDKLDYYRTDLTSTARQAMPDEDTAVIHVSS